MPWKTTNPGIDEDARFKAWLALKNGMAVTAVPGDKQWNSAVAKSVVKAMTGKDPR